MKIYWSFKSGWKFPEIVLFKNSKQSWRKISGVTMNNYDIPIIAKDCILLIEWKE